MLAINGGCSGDGKFIFYVISQHGVHELIRIQLCMVML